MFVLSFFGKTDLSLVSDEEFMATIARIQLRSIALITVPKHHPMKSTSQQKGHRMIRTVGESTIQMLSLVLINQPSGNIASPRRTIIPDKSR